MKVEIMNIEKLELNNGTSFLNCFIDITIETPPDFIAVKCKGENLTHYIKVSNIASFTLKDSERVKLWDFFQPLPLTIRTKNN